MKQKKFTMSTQKADYHLQTVKYDILWDNEFTAIKHFLTEFARVAQTAIEKVAQWFVWICKQVGQLIDCELRRADSEIMDLVDGRYDGRIRRFENRYGGLSR